MTDTTIKIKTLTREAILEYAQQLCPKIANLVKEGGPYDPFVFETKRGAKIIAPAYQHQNCFGFRSFLQVVGPNPRYIINGQPSSNTKSLAFFGESGPALEYRDNALTGSVWGISRYPHLPESALLGELAKKDTVEQAVEFIGSNFPQGYSRESAVSSVLFQSRTPVQDGVPVVLKHLSQEEGLSVLRMRYKAKAPLFKALQENGVPLEDALFQWRKCEMPELVQRELEQAGIANAAQLVKSAFNSVEQSYECKESPALGTQEWLKTLSDEQLKEMAGQDEGCAQNIKRGAKI